MLIEIKKKQANWTSLPTEKKDNVSHIKKKNYSSGLLDSDFKEYSWHSQGLPLYTLAAWVTLP